MGDFPAVRQWVAEAVSPVLRLRGGGVEHDFGFAQAFEVYNGSE